MTNLTLKYFVVKARGEVARLILKGSAGKWYFVRFDLTWKRTLKLEIKQRARTFGWKYR